MIKQENRLRTNFEFNVARKYGVKTVTAHFVVCYAKPTNYTGSTKVGIVVPNRLHSTAVRRNRTKRVIREYFTEKLPLLPADLWISVNVKSSILELDHAEVVAELDKALQKILISD